MHNTTAACWQSEVEQVYIKSECGHSILLQSKLLNSNYAGNNNLLDPLYFGHLSCFTFLKVENINVKILQFDTCSVDFISEAIKDRRNPSTLVDQKLSTQTIQRKRKWIKIGWKIKILYTFQICEI